jgi:hypothetical protein
VKCTEFANCLKSDNAKEIAKVVTSEKEYKFKILCWRGVIEVSSQLVKVNVEISLYIFYF